jgi:hypothetical protein
METQNLGLPSFSNIDIEPVLFWRNGPWKQPPIFETPEDGVPIKTIYVDKETGKLVIIYDDEKDDKEN